MKSSETGINISNEPCEDACLEGYCQLTKEGCVPKDDEDCRETNACRNNGACHALNGYCVAKTDVDCQNSKNCKSDGNCRASGGRCLPLVPSDCSGPEHSTDRYFSPCLLENRCELIDGRCQASDCSERCKLDGRCKLESKMSPRSKHRPSGVLYRYCEFDPDVDCQETIACKSEGLCTNIKASKGIRSRKRACTATNRSCQKSDACKNERRCVAMVIQGNVKRCEQNPVPQD